MLVLFKRHSVSRADVFLADGFHFYAVFHAGHGGYEADEFLAVFARWDSAGAGEGCVSRKGGEAADASEVGFGVVLYGRCPSVDDVAWGEGAALGFKVFVVGFERAPCGSVAHDHGGELHEGRVGLLRPHALPL